MKVLHIVQHLHKISGVSVYCSESCDELQKLGVETSIGVQNLNDKNCLPSQCGVARLSVADLYARKCDYDIVHIHNLWTPVLHRASVWARRYNVPVVWSLHGTLSPWAFKFKWWKKFLPWHLYQRKDLASAAILHVTSEAEREWVRSIGLNGRIENIPMGTSLVGVDKKDYSAKRLLFVGRIAPVKALEKLIAAWAKVKDQQGWELRIVGVEDFAGYTDSLKALCDQLGLADSVHFVGPKFGDELTREYIDASALALVSETENFGAVVADALAVGLPVITSRGTLWRDVADRQCGWWVENAPEKLASVIDELVHLSADDLGSMGARAKQLAIEKYSWASAAASMKEVYETLVRR